MASFDEALRLSTEYFGGDELAASVFVTKYALTSETGEILEPTPVEMHRRLASEFSRIEKKYSDPLSEDEIFNLLDQFKFIVPQGSPMSGIGNPHQLQSVSNCFVIESPEDSYGGILKVDQELVQIAKRRGGVGFDISTLRPRGVSTQNCARTTDGIEVFMDRYSNSCREVAQGGRRGALMLTISVHHPQIRDFVRIKQSLDRVTGANISVKLTDEFLSAVENDSDFELRFPVDSEEPIINEMISAGELWDDIIECAHATAEPGLLFWDNARNLTPSDIYSDDGFSSVSTNPCGEIILSPYDSCRLMLVNLWSFVKDPFTNKARFNFELFADVVQKAQRLMDDMIDIEIEQVDKILTKIENDPERQDTRQIEYNLWHNIKKQAELGRRAGLGVTAVGDMLAGLGITYGSDESIRVVGEIYKDLAINAYKASCILAGQRGAFPVYDYEKESGHVFIERLLDADPHLRELMRKNGRRNIALITTAPAGSCSMLTQTTSGIEPAYMLKYTRRKKINVVAEKGSKVDFVDDTGDMWQEYTVYHHNFKKWMSITGMSDINDSPYSLSTSNDIDWIAKVKIQAAAQRWVCHAISNTTNLPADTDVETVKNIYMEAWKSGCKGITIYRDGCRTGVLVSSDKIVEHSAPRRPESLPCEIHHAKIKGEKWTILVGCLEGVPYEVIGGLAEFIEIPKKYTHGTLFKRPRKSTASKYDLIFGENGNEVSVKDIVQVFDNPNHSAYTRTISLALRHGVPIQYLVEQLQKDKDADLYSFSRVVARVLKKYIIDGTKAGNGTLTCQCENEEQCNVVYQEGCAICLTCGISMCG